MAARKWAEVFEIGERLVQAQAREQKAAEAYRRNADVFTRQVWLESLQEMDQLTTEYLDASLELAQLSPADFENRPVVAF